MRNLERRIESTKLNCKMVLCSVFDLDICIDSPYNMASSEAAADVWTCLSLCIPIPIPILIPFIIPCHIHILIISHFVSALFGLSLMAQ